MNIRPIITAGGIGCLLLYCHAAAEEAATKNPALQALEEDLANTKLELARAKRSKQQVLVDFWQSQLPLVEADLRKARKMLADGEALTHETVLQMIKDREKATEDRLARERKQFEAESTAVLEAARAERDAAREAAHNEYRAATDKAYQSYQDAIAPADLLRRFQTATGPIRLVIWNLPPDRSMHGRAARQVKVKLFGDDKLVWQSRSLKLEPRQANTEIVLPQVLFDQVVIDVLRWSGEGAGLAEVELFIGNENAALYRPCEVTNIDDAPEHADDQHALTDEIRRPTDVGTGYWIAQPRKKASIRINLLGQCIEPPKNDNALGGVNLPRP
jgi:hypothetical protein